MEKNEVEIIEKEIGNVLEIENSGKIMKMPTLMGESFTKLDEYIMKKGVRIMNAPYARYVDIEWESQMKKGFLANFIEIFTKEWHFFCGMAVENELGGEHPIKPNMIGKRKYVEKIHCGPYKKVGNTYKEMYNWALKENVHLDSESFEFYLNNPNETDSQDLKTMVLVPVLEK